MSCEDQPGWMPVKFLPWTWFYIYRICFHLLGKMVWKFLGKSSLFMYRVEVFHLLVYRGIEKTILLCISCCLPRPLSLYGRPQTGLSCYWGYLWFQVESGGVVQCEVGPRCCEVFSFFSFWLRLYARIEQMFYWSLKVILYLFTLVRSVVYLLKMLSVLFSF